ncbi:hypothetical protein BKA70DRAFT_454831 [Coprinopsis sp. MPI-PUGE-AT-0042]|nr:hypothetical protein BKA70DRAFT_454831 [Coprinopsis sp. MPI-PUGE-AT-0042]
MGQFFLDEAVSLIIGQMHSYTDRPIRHTHSRTWNWRDSLNIFEGEFRWPSLFLSTYSNHHLFSPSLHCLLRLYLCLLFPGTDSRSQRQQ